MDLSAATRDHVEDFTDEDLQRWRRTNKWGLEQIEREALREHVMLHRIDMVTDLTITLIMTISTTR